jgi:hypothetical protein
MGLVVIQSQLIGHLNRIQQSHCCRDSKTIFIRRCMFLIADTHHTHSHSHVLQILNSLFIFTISDFHKLLSLKGIRADYIHSFITFIINHVKKIRLVCARGIHLRRGVEWLFPHQCYKGPDIGLHVEWKMLRTLKFYKQTWRPMRLPTHIPCNCHVMEPMTSLCS